MFSLLRERAAVSQSEVVTFQGGVDLCETSVAEALDAQQVTGCALGQLVQSGDVLSM